MVAKCVSLFDRALQLALRISFRCQVTDNPVKKNEKLLQKLREAASHSWGSAFRRSSNGFIKRRFAASKPPVDIINRKIEVDRLL